MGLRGNLKGRAPHSLEIAFIGTATQTLPDFSTASEHSVDRAVQMHGMWLRQWLVFSPNKVKVDVPR